MLHGYGTRTRLACVEPDGRGTAARADPLREVIIGLSLAFQALFVALAGP